MPQKKTAIESSREAEIKAALIDRLIARGFKTPRDVLINEFALPTWQRRADIVVVNGCLHIFEIKSDGDSLDRLDGQLRMYKQYAEKVSVVCAPRHTEEVLKLSPHWVEVIEVRGTSGNVCLRAKREGAPHSKVSKASLISLLTAGDLASLLRGEGFTLPKPVYRLTLNQLAQRLPVETLKAAALLSLKKRFSKTSTRFIAARDKSTFADDLRLLSRRNLIEI